MKSFVIKLIFLIICVIMHYSCDAKKKVRYGIEVPICQILSNGQIFWSPKDASARCPKEALCHKHHRLYKEKIGRINACCCQLKNLEKCPNCEMAYANRMPLWYWFNVQMNRTNGPADGICDGDRVKRILEETGKPTKCCCEPRSSPFVPKEMKERKKP